MNSRFRFTLALGWESQTPIHLYALLLQPFHILDHILIPQFSFKIFFCFSIFFYFLTGSSVNLLLPSCLDSLWSPEFRVWTLTRFRFRRPMSCFDMHIESEGVFEGSGTLAAVDSLLFPGFQIPDHTLVPQISIF